MKPVMPWYVRLMFVSIALQLLIAAVELLRYVRWGTTSWFDWVGPLAMGALLLPMAIQCQKQRRQAA